MARSETIWVFVDRTTGRPEAAFTVKYEAKTWFRRRGGSLPPLLLYRMGDGSRPKPTYVWEDPAQAFSNG